MIQRGKPWHKYKDKLIQAMQNFALSELFGWTPVQIRNLSEDERFTYVALLKGRSQAKLPKTK